MHLIRFFLLCPVSWAYYSFKGSPIEMINQARWKHIATGQDPFIWMINFYCIIEKELQKIQQKCEKSFVLRNEYTDAVTMLKGIVKSAAFKVSSDFPAFVRVPSVMLYLPNSTEPYVYEMETIPNQIKRPAFHLVNYIKDVVLAHINSAQIRNVLSSWEMNSISEDLMENLVANDVPNQCYFILIYSDLHQHQHLLQILAIVATAVKTVYGISEKEVNFGATNILRVQKALKTWNASYVAPKFWFFGPRNAPQNKKLTWAYDGRMDAADVARWVISRYADMKIIPDDAVQINVKREAGFVGQLINIADNRFLLSTN